MVKQGPLDDVADKVTIINRDTFESQFRDDLVDLATNPAVGDIHRAFEVLSLQLLEPPFDLQDAIHDTRYDGADDQGIDGCYIDDEGQAMSLYQFKCPDIANGKLPIWSSKYDESPISELKTGYELLRDQSKWAEVVKSVRAKGRVEKALELQDLGDLYRICTSKGYALNLVTAIGGTLTEGAKTFLNTWRPENAFTRIVTTEDIYLRYRLRSIPVEPPPDFVEIDFVPGRFYFDQTDGVVSGQVRASTIKKVMKDRETALLGSNFRYYLGTTGRQGRVNKDIEETLEDVEKRKTFHRLNNGIRIVGTRIDKLADSLFRVTYPQIVNGGQTSATIRRADDSELPSEVTVEVKVVTATSSEAEVIARATNTQESVEGWDFHANEVTQRALLAAFENLRLNGVKRPHWWDVKRGEFEKLLEIKKLTFRVPGRKLFYRIDPDVLSKATLSFAGQPVAARSNPRLFPRTEGGGKYNLIFKTGRTPEEFLYCYYTYRAAERECKKFSESYDKAEANKFVGMKRSEKLEMQHSRWLRFGSTHMTALIGFLLEERYGKFNREIALGQLARWVWQDQNRIGYDIPMNPVFEPAFDLVKRQLRTWARLKQEAQGFDWSNFFKEADSFDQMTDELVTRLSEPGESDKLQSILPGP
jgi:hypothetical protein